MEYGATDYGRMIGDRTRTDAYAEALRRTVFKDAVVLDLGTGPGIWALLACRFGARRVYAVDPSPIIHLAELLAAENGYADRITFIRDLSTRIALPEPVDIVVSDVHGALPLFRDSVRALIDAHRFLRPGGIMIPRQDVLRVSLLESTGVRHELLAPWEADGFRAEAARQLVLNSIHAIYPEPAHLLSQPQSWGTLDYLTLESPNLSGEVRLVAERPGLAEGLVVWFDSVLAEGVALSSAPGHRTRTFGRLFFPWLEPVQLGTGDTAVVALRAACVDSEYVFRWDSRVYEGTAMHDEKASFHQSTFHSLPFSVEALRQQANKAGQPS